jgi:hypothetical protein
VERRADRQARPTFGRVLLPETPEILADALDAEGDGRRELRGPPDLRDESDGVTALRAGLLHEHVAMQAPRARLVAVGDAGKEHVGAAGLVQHAADADVVVEPDARFRDNAGRGQGEDERAVLMMC